MREQYWSVNPEQPIINKRAKPDPDLQPLYYEQNGTYYESGIYINPLELKQSDLFPALPEETD